MRTIIHKVRTWRCPDAVSEQLETESGLVLLKTGTLDFPSARYSFLTARPFLTLRVLDERCEIRTGTETVVKHTNPWNLMESLLGRFQLPEEDDYAIPLGGCFGFWGYELNQFVEPRLRRTSDRTIPIPDSQMGFYDSLLVFDHVQREILIVSTGILPNGARDLRHAVHQIDWWRSLLDRCSEFSTKEPRDNLHPFRIESNASKSEFIRCVERAQQFIRAGDIYQVNLSHCLVASAQESPWDFFRRLSIVAPAPFSAFINFGDFQLVSSSPELFLEFHQREVTTRPIKGTRPRGATEEEDAQLSVDLETNAKERAELVMITDLLRNDLGRVCEFGSVQVPKLFTVERFSHVQHLVATVQGRLRPDISPLRAMWQCFPGGSITGAPKIRAMEIIALLEQTTRGPYTGSLGYFGFNGQAQQSILIRTAICCCGRLYFQVGAGIVADSVPEAEYAETLAKAGGFFAALGAEPFGMPNIHCSEITAK